MIGKKNFSTKNRRGISSRASMKNPKLIPYLMVKDWMLSQRSGTRQGCLLLPFLSSFFFQGCTHAWHKEVLRLGAELELKLLATATATQDVSRICGLHHSSWQCQILNPLSEPRHQTCNLMVHSRIHFSCATTGTPQLLPFLLNTTEGPSQRRQARNKRHPDEKLISKTIFFLQMT